MSTDVAVDTVDAKSDPPPSTKSITDDVDATLTRMTLKDREVPSTNDESIYRYHMNNKRRGRFIIISNKNFLEVTGMSVRNGTDVDASSLKIDFERLGFTVTVERDQKCAQMMKLMTTAAAEDHSDCDCIGVAVLTHGDNSVLYGTDGIVTVDNFIAPIKHCRTLIGKPKIFIFQACRGTELDPGVEVHDGELNDSKKATRRIPIEADILQAYSTVPGYFAWRNSVNGSWFVQAIHRMMEKYAFNVDFLRLMTRVCHEVAYDFESHAADKSMNQKKQVPSIVSTLTKEIYF